MTSDQANLLFVSLIVAGVAGGKFFVLFEDPAFYFSHPGELFSKNGFVFYGSLLTAIPVMLWFFKRNTLPVLGMLDVMAMVTCIVHGFGRIGCFNAGCCYGKPTDTFLGAVFTDPACQAQPLNTPLHPTQLYEAGFIFALLIILYFTDRNKKFDGQIFLIYLIAYAAGRSVLELLRGDVARGFIIEGVVSNSQLVSFLIVVTAIFFYLKLKQKAYLSLPKENGHGK